MWHRAQRHGGMLHLVRGGAVGMANLSAQNAVYTNGVAL